MWKLQIKHSNLLFCFPYLDHVKIHLEGVPIFLIDFVDWLGPISCGKVVL